VSASRTRSMNSIACLEYGGLTAVAYDFFSVISRIILQLSLRECVIEPD